MLLPLTATAVQYRQLGNHILQCRTLPVDQLSLAIARHCQLPAARVVAAEDAFYCLGEKQIDAGETLMFSFRITPGGEIMPCQLSLQQRFSTN